jgi:osmotically-inducible protein OsmY
MRRTLLPISLIVVSAGCVRSSAVSRGAHAIRGKVSPVARAFSDGSRRLVRYAGQAADDATLVAKVKAALTFCKGGDAGEIQVCAEEGVIRLSGRVSSSARKHLAGEIARNTMGVTSVENRLKVTAPVNASGG